MLNAHESKISMCLTQREIAAELNFSIAVVCHFLEDPNNYGKAKLTGKPKNITVIEQKDKKCCCEGYRNYIVTIRKLPGPIVVL